MFQARLNDLFRFVFCRSRWSLTFWWCLQLQITVGIFVAQALGLIMSEVVLWRWLLALGGFVALVQSILLPSIPETPRWLLLKRRDDDALRALQRIRGDDVDVTDEMASFGSSSSGEGDGEAYSIPQLLKDRSLRKSVAIAVGLQLTQQLSGINAVFYYSTDIFEESFPDQAEYITMSIGALNVLLTIASAALIDRAGRRILILLSDAPLFSFFVAHASRFVQGRGVHDDLCIALCHRLPV